MTFYYSEAIDGYNGIVELILLWKILNVLYAIFTNSSMQ